MSNDYSDLTDMVSDIIRTYMDDDSYSDGFDGSLVDLDAWDTDDLLQMEAIFRQALDLRLDDNELERMREMASREMEEEELIPLSEYLDSGEQPVYDEDDRDLEAEYDDPLFVG
jgi:hypothetical protein